VELLILDAATFVSAQFWINVGLLAGIYGIFTLGLQLNVGFTGLFNFAQAGFMAVGAYAMAILVTKAHWSLWLALPAAAGVAVCVALIVGIPSLRLRGDYFAIATIAFSETIRYVIENTPSLTGGLQGLLGFDGDWQRLAPRILSGIGLGPEYYLVPLLIVTWAVFLVALLVLELLRRTPWGRVLRAIREDEDAVRAFGKRVFLYKLQSLGLAAVLAAISGYLLALDISYLSADEFLPEFTFIAFTMLLVGGLGSYLGVVVGAVLMETILEGTRAVGLPLSDARLASLRFIIVGLLLIALVIIRPQGILGKRSEMVMRR
jgi:branched-chain amino acid transport system permease protein